MREVKAANKALIGRQIWRIHENPKLLVSKFLKAKYKFEPITSGRHYKIPRNSSWAWKSMMKCASQV